MFNVIFWYSCLSRSRLYNVVRPLTFKVSRRLFTDLFTGSARLAFWARTQPCWKRYWHTYRVSTLTFWARYTGTDQSGLLLVSYCQLARVCHGVCDCQCLGPAAWGWAVAVPVAVAALKTESDPKFAQLSTRLSATTSTQKLHSKHNCRVFALHIIYHPIAMSNRTKLQTT